VKCTGNLHREVRQNSVDEGISQTVKFQDWRIAPVSRSWKKSLSRLQMSLRANAYSFEQSKQAVRAAACGAQRFQMHSPLAFAFHMKRKISLFHAPPSHGKTPGSARLPTMPIDPARAMQAPQGNGNAR
jgi:hypothetical protein